MAASLEEDFGIETFVGNQTTVSAMRIQNANNGNVAWRGLSTIQQGHAAFRERERECRVVPEACG
jgi:hypothetical protein